MLEWEATQTKAEMGGMVDGEESEGELGFALLAPELAALMPEAPVVRVTPAAAPCLGPVVVEAPEGPLAPALEGAWRAGGAPTFPPPKM